MCGDHDLLRSSFYSRPGSPPHVRGPLALSSNCVTISGITPACAGTTVNSTCYIHVGRDHPRMCGDHMDKLPYEKMVMGSPPHVRGPQMLFPMSSYDRGITPACAGTTVKSIHAWLSARDHPRMCGDHLVRFSMMRSLWGSPPHVRGPRDIGGKGMKSLGITPACAGTTGWTKI